MKKYQSIHLIFFSSLLACRLTYIFQHAQCDISGHDFLLDCETSKVVVARWRVVQVVLERQLVYLNAMSDGANGPIYPDTKGHTCNQVRF